MHRFIYNMFYVYVILACSIKINYDSHIDILLRFYVYCHLPARNQAVF